jgi:hypothetical protein
MAITTAFCDSAKLAFLRGEHAAGDTYKIALIKVGHTGTYGTATTAFGTSAGSPTASNLGTDEVAAGGGYTAGGATLGSYATAVNANVASNDWANAQWTTATFSAVGCMIYNDTDAGKPVVCVIDFGGTITSSGGNFDITIPSAGTGLVRI